MSGGGYRCVHVPLRSTVGLTGVKTWIIAPVLIVMAWTLVSPWVILGPIAFAATIATYVAAVRFRRTHPRISAPVEVPPVRPARRVPPVLPPGVRVLSTVRAGVMCLGCRSQTAIAVVEIRGQRVPVCAPCQSIALGRIAAGFVKGVHS